MKTSWTISFKSRAPAIQHKAKAIRLLFCAALCGVICCSAVPAAFGQFQFERLKSFGFPERAGAFPTERLIEASDGKLYGTAQGAGTVFTLNQDGGGYSVLHTFAPDDPSGEVNTRGVIEGRDGALYGTTSSGHVAGREGTVFRLNKDGSGYMVLRSFSGADGLFPSGPLLQGGDGALYGTTRVGGPNHGDAGTVFKLNQDGSNYAVLHRFVRTEGSLVEPGRLVEGNDGALYGVTQYGGVGNYGTVFRLNKNGNGYTVLRDFFFGGAGRHPVALIKGSDGLLYGITSGERGNRTVFKLNEDGSGYGELHNFMDAEGRPLAILVEGSDGFLYGTTEWGGASGGGTVFKLNKDGSGFAVVRDFASAETDGHGPAGLVEGSDRALYGTTERGGDDDAGTVFKLRKDGGGFAVLHNFFTTNGDGRVPSHLITGTDGALYGTTVLGGTNNVGTFFKVNQDGSEPTVLRSFGPDAYDDDHADGWRPLRLSEGSDGLLYGITENGGSTNRGTVFKIHKDGNGYAVLHRFTVGFGDGRQLGGFIASGDGVLYGTTLRGGSNDAGMVFKLNADGSGYRVLHSFAGALTDKYYVGDSLIEGSDGALYGTKYSYVNEGVSGIVFKLNKDGSAFVVLHSFDNTANEWPIGLLEGSDAALYGTTKHGGSQGEGTVFKLHKDGSGYAVLHSFTSAQDGGWPSADLVEGSDGGLYGTAGGGGISGGGTLFRLNKDGTVYSVLHSFSRNAAEGWSPGSLANGSGGTLYGITGAGGNMGFGTVFSLRPQPVMLPPIVSGDGMQVRFFSMPGSTHRLQRASTLDGSWLTLTNLVVPASGISEFTDPAPPQPGGFYRTVTP